MKKQEILKKIGNILNELNEQFDYLRAEETNLNDLELELFAANAKFLTDHTEILRKINAQLQSVQFSLPAHTDADNSQAYTEATPLLVEEATAANIDQSLPPMAASALNYDLHAVEETQPYHEPIEPETPAASDADTIAVTEEHVPQVSIEPAHSQDSYNYLRHEPEISENQHGFSLGGSYTQEEITPPHVDLTEPTPTLFAAPEVVEAEHTEDPAIAEQEPQPTPIEPVAVVEPTPVEDNEPVAEPQVPAPAPEPPVHTFTPPVTTTPAIAEQPLTLNERLSAQLNIQKPAVAATSAQPVSDIKSAISLNDKMLFVKDLFNGYSLAYSEAIELLNRCKSFAEADRFLKSNYVAKNNWADKPGTVDKFYAILHRRFTA